MEQLPQTPEVNAAPSTDTQPPQVPKQLDEDGARKRALDEYGELLRQKAAAEKENTSILRKIDASEKKDKSLQQELGASQKGKNARGVKLVRKPDASQIVIKSCEQYLRLLESRQQNLSQSLSELDLLLEPDRLWSCMTNLTVNNILIDCYMNFTNFTSLS